MITSGVREVVHLQRERTILMPPEYVEKYVRWMRSAGRADKTITQRTRMAQRILLQWPDPGAVDPAALTDWLGSLGSEDGEPLARWTRATYHSDVRSFFVWLHAAGHIHEDPSDSQLVIRPKARSGVPKPLSAGEESRALEHAHGNMRAWLLLALRAGLRASEIAGIRGEHVSEDFLIFYGKGSKESSIPTHPELWSLAQEYPRRGWWFPSPAHAGHISGNSVTIMVGRHFRRPEVDIPTGSIHRARHSYATSLLRRGANLRQVQTLMRHESPATTAIYTAVDEDEMRAAVNRLGA